MFDEKSTNRTHLFAPIQLPATGSGRTPPPHEAPTVRACFTKFSPTFCQKTDEKTHLTLDNPNTKVNKAMSDLTDDPCCPLVVALSGT